MQLSNEEQELVDAFRKAEKELNALFVKAAALEFRIQCEVSKNFQLGSPVDLIDIAIRVFKELT